MSALHFFLHSVAKKHISPLLVVLVVLLTAASLHAQIVETGVITGVVKDNTNAVIPGAHVTVRNTGTGLATITSTDTQGIYVSPPLHPGDYTVVIEVPGFNNVVEKVRLEVGQRAAANATLAVGSNAETIEVQATGQLLDTESSTVGNLRTEEAVKDLPLNGRNFAELLGLGAGVIPAQTQLVSVPYTQQRGPSSYAFAGLRYQENRLLLDGIGDNENHNGLAVVIFPPIDAIQEFSEETTDADARYGRGNGGTINLVYKSGTDHYHGEVFDFFRNSVLDARNYFDTAAKPPLRENEFGATLGGPAFYKQAYPKTFFFADYSGERIAQGLTNVDTVPDFKLTATGYDFSAYPAGSIKNPTTKVAYANNFIPLSDVNSTGSNILNFYQKNASPNIAGKTTANNFLFNPVRTDNEDAFDVRVDHKFSEKDSGFLRYSQANGTLSQPGTLPVPLVGAVICGPAKDLAHQAVLGETHILSTSIVNTARFGWSRLFVNANNWDLGLDLPTLLGIPGVEVAGDPRSDGLPVMSFSGNTSIGDAGNSPTQIGTNNYQWDDNVNLVRGKHSIDLGFELVRLEYNMFQTAAEHGSESFGTSYSGLAWTDLLFGAPKSGSYAYVHGTRGFRQSDLSFYVQDNYKVSNRLTLNLGVRYENILGWPWTEVNNKMYNFVPSISTTTLEQVGSQGVPRSGVSGNNLNFAPRVGFAYKVTSKTVLHAGFGLYYSAPNVTNSSGLSNNVPGIDYWAFNNSATFGAATNGTPFNYASNGFAHTQVTSLSALPANLPVFSQDPNAKTPYSEQWHATLQQEIPFSTVITVAYVGTKGIHLDNLRDINAGSPGTTSVTTGRPYPSFAQINELETRQISNYNALQISAERRTHGLGFLASYSYSHSLDEGTGSPGSVLNPYNIHADYGNSDLNIPNRFVASATYELPFKGKGTLGHFERGWQLNTILNYSDGLPFSVGSSNGVGDGLTPRAQLVPGNGNGSLPSGKRTLGEWFNTSAFVSIPLTGALANGQWGNSGRNILQGPGTKNVDFSVFKNTHLTKAKVLQLRAEFFNLFNAPQFNNPAATAPTPAAGSTTLVSNITPGSTYGTVSSAGSPQTFQRISREIQFAAKITF
jgi:hypothetical protein